MLSSPFSAYNPDRPDKFRRACYNLCQLCPLRRQALRCRPFWFDMRDVRALTQAGSRSTTHTTGRRTTGAAAGSLSHRIRKDGRALRRSRLRRHPVRLSTAIRTNGRSSNCACPPVLADRNTPPEPNGDRRWQAGRARARWLHRRGGVHRRNMPCRRALVSHSKTGGAVDGEAPTAPAVQWGIMAADLGGQSAATRRPTIMVGRAATN
jgi:hypothetical protein